MFVVVIMKSKAEISFGKEMLSCFCLALTVSVLKHDGDLDNLSYILDGISFIRGEASAFPQMSPSHDRWTERSQMKHASWGTNISSVVVI